jgi:hypothetical protein
MAKAKSGGGAKIGRNKDKCHEYFTERRRAKNKARTIRRLYGDDAAAQYLREYTDAKRLTTRKGAVSLKKEAK